MRKEKDEHYEELVVAHNLIGDIYYNFLYTDTNKEFPKNDYGTVDLTMLVPGVRDGKRMDTFLANTFHSKISGEEYVCQWGKGCKSKCASRVFIVSWNKLLPYTINLCWSCIMICPPYSHGVKCNFFTSVR